MTKLPVTNPLKKTESFLTSNCSQKFSTVKSFNSSLPQFLGVLFHGILSRLFASEGWEWRYGEEVVVDASVSHSLPRVCSQGKQTSEQTKKFPCPLQSLAAWIRYFHMVSGDNMDHGHPQSPQHQHKAWISAWSPEAVQTMDVSMAPCRRMDHQHHHCPQR